MKDKKLGYVTMCKHCVARWQFSNMFLISNTELNSSPSIYKTSLSNPFWNKSRSKVQSTSSYRKVILRLIRSLSSSVNVSFFPLSLFRKSIHFLFSFPVLSRLLLAHQTAVVLQFNFSAEWIPNEERAKREKGRSRSWERLVSVRNKLGRGFA